MDFEIFLAIALATYKPGSTYVDFERINTSVPGLAPFLKRFDGELVGDQFGVQEHMASGIMLGDYLRILYDSKGLPESLSWFRQGQIIELYERGRG